MMMEINIDYSKFHKLQRTAPKMSCYLIEWFANREKKFALKVIMKSYRPHVSTDFVREKLGLADETEWETFLTSTQLETSIVYVNGSSKQKINSKDTAVNLGV